eukprot:CAMPEP_0119414556 /NCGR_PEP_ID=MMETSP1335-20130426/7053_1 /TAXON_ID=259385 /ORGANISM="Chrysoculter rhomboideus, Strain RCC1486" /LENGTH=265 /DNA_ID=CAMNT_0007439439 /DNA_START=19 /DNA_END=816 /DNA_ORIENTATION=+
MSTGTHLPEVIEMESAPPSPLSVRSIESEPDSPMKAGSPETPQPCLKRSGSLPLIFARDGTLKECPICLEAIEDTESEDGTGWQRLPCGHDFCTSCLDLLLKDQGAPSAELIAYACLSDSTGARKRASRTCKCPLCRSAFDMSQFVELTPADFEAARDQIERRRERAAQLAELFARMPRSTHQPAPTAQYAVAYRDTAFGGRGHQYSIVERAQAFFHGQWTARRPVGSTPARRSHPRRLRRIASLENLRSRDLWQQCPVSRVGGA